MSLSLYERRPRNNVLAPYSALQPCAPLHMQCVNRPYQAACQAAHLLIRLCTVELLRVTRVLQCACMAWRANTSLSSHHRMSIAPHHHSGLSL